MRWLHQCCICDLFLPLNGPNNQIRVFPIYRFLYFLSALNSLCHSAIIRRQHLHIISGPSVHQLSDGWMGGGLCWQMSGGGLRSLLSVRYLSVLHIRPFICCLCLSLSPSFSPLMTCTLSLSCGRLQRWECSGPSIFPGTTVCLQIDLALNLTRCQRHWGVTWGPSDMVSVRKLIDCLSTVAAAVFGEISKCRTVMSAPQTGP